MHGEQQHMFVFAHTDELTPEQRAMLHVERPCGFFTGAL